MCSCKFQQFGNGHNWTGIESHNVVSDVHVVVARDADANLLWPEQTSVIAIKAMRKLFTIPWRTAEHIRSGIAQR
jgi:hypothetical protein